MPASSESLSKALAAISEFSVGDATLCETLQQVADLSCATIPNTAMAGITMLVEGEVATAVFTDEVAPEIDSAQYETGAGPCLDAFRHRQVFRIDDMQSDTEWPAFSTSASSHGIASSMSSRWWPTMGIGALNLYSHVTSAHSDHEVEVGLQFAAHAAIVLAHAQAYADAQQFGLDMATAMKSRAGIEQAKGILMSAQHCSADDAFQMLVRASQRENRKLRDIAEDIVARTVADAPASPTEMTRGGVADIGRHLSARSAG